jgi:hypothetical protein
MSTNTQPQWLVTKPNCLVVDQGSDHKRTYNLFSHQTLDSIDTTTSKVRTARTVRTGRAYSSQSHPATQSTKDSLMLIKNIEYELTVITGKPGGAGQGQAHHQEHTKPLQQHKF